MKFVLLGMLSIVLLGTGNVAQHLFGQLRKLSNVNVVQVYGRNKSALRYFEEHSETTTEKSAIANADLYILAISDTSISSVSELVSSKNGLIVHTSGSMPLNAIASERRGVFYPLQTFTKGKTVNFKEIPICLEVEQDTDRNLLETLAHQISQKVVWIASDQRKKLHLSAVIVNNFSNHFYVIAKEICDEENVPFDLLKPLIRETADKITHMDPKGAQTGPARRNDVMTQQEHLEQLKNPLHKKLYQLLSESIKQHYEKEL